MLYIFSTLKGNSREYQYLHLKRHAKTLFTWRNLRMEGICSSQDQGFLFYSTCLTSFSQINYFFPAWEKTWHMIRVFTLKDFIFIVIFTANLADTANYLQESHLPLVQCGVSKQCPMSQNPSLFPEL